MKICLVTPEYPDCGRSWGVGRSVCTLATALRGAGTHVTVLVVAKEGCFIGRNSGMESVAKSTWPSALRPWAAAAWIDDQCTRLRPDAVEFQNWGGLGAWSSWGGPRVVRLSTPAALSPPRDRIRAAALPFHRWNEQRTVLSADVVIANSRCMAAIGASVYRRTADVIIPHAYADKVRPIVEGGESVLFVGRLERRKGVDLLIAGWHLVTAQLPDAILHLVGEDTDHVATGRMPRGVCVHGRLDDDALVELRTSCRIQVVPSRFESFGLVVLEAWAGGQAVIASAGGALPEVIGSAGLISPVEDVEVLANLILLLLADRRRCQEFAGLGQDRLRTTYSGQALAERSHAAYGLAMTRAARTSAHHGIDGTVS